MARAGTALVLANARYWSTVAPLVRAQLHHWEQRAGAIPDPVLRALALENIRDEGFNAEAAATLATLTRRARRPCVIEAIVAFQVMYDYLDGLIEQPVTHPLRNGSQLFKALTDTISQTTRPRDDYYRYNPQTEDGGYLGALVITIKNALARVFTTTAFANLALCAAERCAEGQVRAHAAISAGTAQVEEWAKREAANTALEWHEFLAGTLTSVMTVYALIATADEHATSEQGRAIDTTYLSIGALSTMLDRLVDHDHDAIADSLNYVGRYGDRDFLAQRLMWIVRLATAQARTLPNAAHHIMTLVGVVAYYTSAPTATSEFAKPVTAQVQRELRPLITPTLAVMRAWRLAKRLRRRPQGSPPSTITGPG